MVAELGLGVVLGGGTADRGIGVGTLFVGVEASPLWCPAFLFVCVGGGKAGAHYLGAMWCHHIPFLGKATGQTPPYVYLRDIYIYTYISL